jgi:hypothetical protein
VVLQWCYSGVTVVVDLVQEGHVAHQGHGDGLGTLRELGQLRLRARVCVCVCVSV